MRQLNLNQSSFSQNIIIIIEFGLIMLITIALILKFRLIHLLNINWDEFTFLSLIYDFNSDILNKQFQTFHVHFFRWLPFVFNNEISQIIAARSIMYTITLGSCLLTYLIGRQFLNRSGALFATLCYIAFSYLLEHGTSFRFDPICAFLFLLSVFFLIRKPYAKWSLIASAFVMSISLLVSIKAVFHISAIAAIFFVRFFIEENSKKIFKQISLFLIVLIGSYLIIYNFHSATLQHPELRQPANYIRTAYFNFIIFDNLFLRWKYLILSIIDNLIIWIFFCVGIVFVIWDLFGPKKTYAKRTIFMFAFLVPFIPLVFYRNAFPYFYVFILSPGIIFCGVFVHWITERMKKKESIVNFSILTLISIAVFLNFLLHYKENAVDRITPQKEVIRLVHKIFPAPVPYIDRCSMVSSFPKVVGFSMSTINMENYLKTNIPIMAELIDHHQPVFLLANSPCINLSLPKEMAVYAGKYFLLEKDWHTLRENFIHHWGILYVAGKVFSFDSSNGLKSFNILIPGTYTYEGNEAALIDGTSYKNGDVLYLGKGKHNISPRQIPATIVLRWGDHIYKPNTIPSKAPIFYGFR